MTPVQLVNLALLKIGHSKGITATSEASREAWTAAQVYDHVLRATLRDFPWPFATKYAALTLVQGPPWDDDAVVQTWDSASAYVVGDYVDRSGTVYMCILAHTNQVPPNATYWTANEDDFTDEANGDWDFAYRWPADCLFARRLVPDNGAGREFDENPIPFRVGRDNNGLLIYTDEVEAVLEYTTIDCTNLWVDDLWIEAFTWKLAGQLAPSLSKDEKMAAKCIVMYKDALERAAAVASKEQQQHKDGDAGWMNARN